MSDKTQSQIILENIGLFAIPTAFFGLITYTMFFSGHWIHGIFIGIVFLWFAVFEVFGMVELVRLRQSNE